MKTKTLFSMALLAAIGFSCSSSDDDTPVATPQDTAPIIAMVGQGSWTVTKYIDHTLTQTDHFTGYAFTFGPNGVLTATNGTNTYTGSWSVTNNSGSDDSPSDSVDLNIAFVAPPDFEDISDDWDFISRTDQKLELIDVSGGNDNTDYITFEKIN